MSKRKLDVQQQTFGFPDKELKTSLHDEIVLWIKSNAAEICRKLIDWTETWDPQLIESNRQLAAATVAERVKLLQESLTEDKSRLEAIDRGRSSFYTTQDLEKRIKAMEGELTYLNSWHGLGEPPAPKLDFRRELEHVILRDRCETNLHIIGYADVVLSVRTLELCAGHAPSDDYGRPYLGVDPCGYTNWSVTWSRFGGLLSMQKMTSAPLVRFSGSSKLTGSIQNCRFTRFLLIRGLRRKLATRALDSSSIQTGLSHCRRTQCTGKVPPGAKLCRNDNFRTSRSRFQSYFSLRKLNEASRRTARRNEAYATIEEQSTKSRPMGLG